MPVDTNDLDPRFHERLNAFTAALTAQGIPAHVISAYRDNALQAKLYAAYQNGTGGIAAPPGQSYHNYGLAADIIPDNPADYPRMWNLAPQFGITPLAQKDKPHFQMQGSLSDLIAGRTSPINTAAAMPPPRPAGPASYPALTSNPFQTPGAPAVAALGAPPAPVENQQPTPPAEKPVDWGALLSSIGPQPAQQRAAPQAPQPLDPRLTAIGSSQPTGYQAPINLLANTTADQPRS